MKPVSSLAMAVLIVNFLILAIPEGGYAGSGMIPSQMECCQVIIDGSFDCADLNGESCAVPENGEFIGIFEGETCNEETGLCSGFDPSPERNVPTLSELGLIAMAAILGIVGFIVMRRKVTA